MSEHTTDCHLAWAYSQPCVHEPAPLPAKRNWLRVILDGFDRIHF